MTGAILKGARRASRIEHGFREIKMLRPVCPAGVIIPKGVDDTVGHEFEGECTRGSHAADWYTTCPHDPYVGTRTELKSERTYETNEFGERIVTGMTTTPVERPYPNLVGVSAATINNSGQGVEKARRKGFILPEELDSPAFPDGLAAFCEFRDCFYQGPDLKQYRSGLFCREGEAIAAYQSEYAEDLGAKEIHWQSRRRSQIEEVRQRVRL